ncbi:MAG: hypothetical protein AMXMBFR72_18590 [Betaproteobacteria bacterium]
MEVVAEAGRAQGARTEGNRYAKCVEVSKRVRWDIDRDVIRGRQFDFGKKFLPDALARLGKLDFITPDEHRFLSQIQGRTYANTFGLVERFIGPKIAEVSRDHWLGDQAAFEALVRFTDEELKHQELFRRLDAMAAQGMPAGYEYVAQPNDVARFVLGKSTWAVLALVCHIEIFVLSHYHQSIDPDADLSPLWKDVFLYHAKEESQHAILDELEWEREDAKLTPAERDRAVDELIELVAGVDGILQAQAEADARYFARTGGRTYTEAQVAQVEATLLAAYRWQYIVSGVQDERFQKALGAKITPAQFDRIGRALTPIMASVAH